MKKIFTLAFAAMLLASCGSDLKSQLIDKIEDCTKTIEKAEDTKEIEEALEDFKAFVEDNKEALEKSKLQEDEDIKKASIEMTTAAVKKSMELKFK